MHPDHPLARRGRGARQPVDAARERRADAGSPGTRRRPRRVAASGRGKPWHGRTLRPARGRRVRLRAGLPGPAARLAARRGRLRRGRAARDRRCRRRCVRAAPGAARRGPARGGVPAVPARPERQAAVLLARGVAARRRGARPAGAAHHARVPSPSPSRSPTPPAGPWPPWIRLALREFDRTSWRPGRTRCTGSPGPATTATSPVRRGRSPTRSATSPRSRTSS